MLVEVWHCPKFMSLENFKRCRTSNLDTFLRPFQDGQEEEASRKSGTLDSTIPSAKKRSVGRNVEEEKLRSLGDEGPYKEVL